MHKKGDNFTRRLLFCFNWYNWYKNEKLTALHFWMKPFLVEFYPRYLQQQLELHILIRSKMIESFSAFRVKRREMDYLANVQKQYIFLMIPMEERRRFSIILTVFMIQIYSLLLEIWLCFIVCDRTRVLCCSDGSQMYQRARRNWSSKVFVWILYIATRTLCGQKSRESKNDITKALTDVYDRIFEFNLDANTVKCLLCEGKFIFKEPLRGLCLLQVEDALEKWLIVSASQWLSGTARHVRNVNLFLSDFVKNGNWRKTATNYTYMKPVCQWYH